MKRWGEYLAENPNCRDTFASLCFFGETLDPEDVTRLLGVAPSNSARKGDAARSGRQEEFSRWILYSDKAVDSTSAEQHVTWLLDRLTPAKASVASVSGVEHACIAVYWVSATGQGGPGFSSEVLARLARHKLALELDLYPSVDRRAEA